MGQRKGGSKVKTKVMRTTALLLFTLFMLSSTDSAYSTDDAAFRYVGVVRILTTLKIESNGLAKPYTSVTLKSGYSADITMALEQSPKGQNDWEEENSWSTSGSGIVILSKSWFVPSGYDYRVVVDVTVYDENGSEVESPSNESAVVEY